VSVDHAVQNAASAVCKAVIDANRCGDPAQCAFDICAVSILVAGEDQAIRTGLALFMLRLARQLDHDVTEATTLQ
jgi:hypothetical protein